MSKHTIETNTRHWLSVHQRVRNHIHRSIVLLAMIAIVAVIQGFGRLGSLNEDYQFAREFTLQIHKEGPRKEVAQYYERKCRNSPSSCENGLVFVKLEKIPELGWEFDRFLSKNHPSGLFEFQGFVLDIASFSLLLLLAPLWLHVAIYLRLRTMAKIALILRRKAVEKNEVQQCLNSVFTERATEIFGERRWLHATSWTLIIFVLAMTTPIFYVTMHTMLAMNTNVVINEIGAITPLPDVGLSERTYNRPLHKDLLNYFLLILLANTSLGLLVWRSVMHQLSPKYQAENETTNNAA